MIEEAALYQTAAAVTMTVPIRKLGKNPELPK
jgi:hypothetical protein